jgi:propionyl-CoA carboxylase alpha chain
MFSKILIANRGEIACRIIRTAHRMGIKTVAVYSDADKKSLHVEMADEAIHIGPPQPAQSYLRVERIVEACRKTGAEAVHPGYGFLSEKTELHKALAAANIVFIGPGPGAIAAMGDKIESKKLAKAAGVSCIPGYLGVIRNAEHAVSMAREVGYPVMIKASAGGGGKGMRLSRNDEETREGFRSAQNEARSSFADDRILIEKYIEQPRHIEMQVLADGQGTVLYLGERECSIQRRHQKIIEEAPSPFVDSATRKAMGEQAVALAHAVDYKSAGTVEFIVDPQHNFYFLEMNTRIQVEHPVTELVTGLDLVELMIRVAAGEKLNLKQEEIHLNGWAIEARVYAEDPCRQFLPSTGRLTYCKQPNSDPHIRVDTGVVEGNEVSIYYDPMIAKLCAWDRTREAAILRMRHALDEYYIRGVTHNVQFLGSLMGRRRFAEGRLTTDFIAQEYPNGFNRAYLRPEDEPFFVVVAAAIHSCLHERARQASSVTSSRNAKKLPDWVVTLGGKQVPVRVHALGNRRSQVGYTIDLDGKQYTVFSDWQPCQFVFSCEVNGDHVCVQVDRIGTGYRLFHGGAEIEVKVLTEREAQLNSIMLAKVLPDTSKFLLSPMPGLLVSLAVQEGQEIKTGDKVAVVEAMKVENILRADRSGFICKLHAAPGTNLAVDQKILEFA